MIRKLSEKDREMVLEFLSKEPSINLFIIGDIEAFGFDEDFQELWGQFTADDKLEGVLLRYHESFIPYFSGTDFDPSGFQEIILSNQGKTLLSGKESILRRFEGTLPNHATKSTYFCEITDSANLKQPDSQEQIKIAKVGDGKRIYDLLKTIKEFSNVGPVDRIEHVLKTKTGRIYYIENDEGKVIAVAQTTAENSKSAMVVGVATLERYRGKGLVSSCLSKLCADVMAEGKTLCLFYDNPKAGRIYHRMGFKTIDNWIMVTE